MMKNTINVITDDDYDSGNDDHCTTFKTALGEDNYNEDCGEYENKEVSDEDSC